MKRKREHKKKTPCIHRSQIRKKTPTPPPPPTTPQPQPEEKKENEEEKKKIPKEVVSVLFVPGTPHSDLATMIRKDKQTISKLSGYHIKIVKRC